MKSFISIGEVVKAVGLRGEVRLYPLLDFYEPLLESGYLVWNDGTPVEVARHRFAGGMAVLKLPGVDSRNAAEALVGRTLGFARESYLEEDFPRPEEGLAFRYLERPIETVDGQAVGTVVEVRRAGGSLLLVFERDGKPVMIPAVEPILRADDGLTGPLVVDPPEGLFDVQLG